MDETETATDRMIHQIWRAAIETARVRAQAFDVDLIVTAF
jgi:hypothetical protein